MKKWYFSSLLALALIYGQGFALESAKIALINFKTCVEESKVGKKEQTAFEAMKKQMENVVDEKENALAALANKLNDPDQLDLMSPEAETELKRKFRAQRDELQNIQAQYMQTLQQANFKIIQNLSEVVAKASEKVAKSENIDLVLNDETCFYINNKLDVSPQVVKEMDLIFDEENRATATK